MLTVLFSYFDKPVIFCALKITFSVDFGLCENWAQIWQVLIKFGTGKNTPNLSSKLDFWTCWLNHFPNRKLKCHYHPSEFLHHLFQSHESKQPVNSLWDILEYKNFDFSYFISYLFHSKSMQFIYNKVVKKFRPSSISDYQCCQHIILLSRSQPSLTYSNFKRC